MTLFELTTAGVPPSQRLELWRNTALRRLDVEKIFENEHGFEGRLRRFTSTNAEFWDHRTDPLWVHRSLARCRMDGRGDISVALVLDCANATVENVRDLTLNSGDLYVIDYSKPVRAARPKHRELALMLPRKAVTDLVGDDLSILAGCKLPSDSVSTLLRSQMRRVADDPNPASVDGLATVFNAISQMAAVALQAFAHGRADADQLSEGLYALACAAIEMYCTDLDFSAQTIASMIGCSRASLYRLFARHGQTVATAIWTARLELAWRTLTQATFRQPISNVAFKCGFSDHATFSRMFKRRYGMAPRDARELGKQGQSKPSTGKQN